MPSSSDLADEDLALLAGIGDRSAFELLLHRHAAGVSAVLRQRLRDSHHAEDLAQEVWIKVYAALGGFRAGGSFRAWLFAIVLNHSRDALRSRRRATFLSLDDVHEQGGGGQPGRSSGPSASGSPSDSPSWPLEQRDAARLVDAALGEVREPYRGALALVDLGGLSYAEAAAVSGCRLGTLKSRVHRARELFREAFLRREAARPGSTTNPVDRLPEQDRATGRVTP